MKRRYSFTIDVDYHGYTLEEFLLQHLPQYKRNTMRKFIYNEAVKINNAIIVDKNYRLVSGDEIFLMLPKLKQDPSVDSLIHLEFLYEDDNFAVVNKPPHVPVIPERWSRDAVFKDSIHDHFAQNNEIDVEPFIVHRIDKEASGAVVIAKNGEWKRYLSKLFEQRQIKKTYYAIVAGTPPESGTVDLPLKQATDKSTRMVVDEKGKAAITHYKVIEFFRDFALVEVNIESGRTHQIRVHMASQGHPLAVDSLYGYRNVIKLSDIKKSYNNKRDSVEKPLISRLTLHARELEFFHPDKNENIVITAPLFKDFEIILKHLRKYRS